MRSAIRSIAGMVRIALKKPPMPQVSWPIMPYRSGIFSSSTRAGSLPTRIWPSTKSAPVSASSKSCVITTRQGMFAAAIIRTHSSPTMRSLRASISIRTSSPIGSAFLRLIMPSMSSGVYVLPEPIMAILMLSFFMSFTSGVGLPGWHNERPL